LNGVHDISFFPNPTSGTFIIRSTEKISQITITDLSGQTIYKKEFLSSPLGVRGVEIDLSSQSKGIYFIQLITERESLTRKIILN